MSKIPKKILGILLLLPISLLIGAMAYLIYSIITGMSRVEIVSRAIFYIIFAATVIVVILLANKGLNLIKN